MTIHSWDSLCAHYAREQHKQAVSETTKAAYDWISDSDSLLRTIRELTATWRDRATEGQRTGMPWQTIVADQLMERIYAHITYPGNRPPISVADYKIIDWEGIVRRITDEDARAAEIAPVAYLA